MNPHAEDLYERMRSDLEVARLRLALVRDHAQKAIDHGAAFGSELTLARRIIAIVDQDLPQ